MSEIRDKTIDKIVHIMRDANAQFMETTAEQILSIPEIAIVDRAPEIPQDTWFWKNCWRQRCKPAKICLECPFFDYKTHTLKGWVKEVNDADKDTR